MEDFFECPWVWLFSACMAGLVLLATCDRYDDGYDPYAWQGGQPEAAGYAMAVYEAEMLANSLPPTAE